MSVRNQRAQIAWLPFLPHPQPPPRQQGGGSRPVSIRRFPIPTTTGRLKGKGQATYGCRDGMRHIVKLAGIWRNTLTAKRYFKTRIRDAHSLGPGWFYKEYTGEHTTRQIEIREGRVLSADKSAGQRVSDWRLTPFLESLYGSGPYEITGEEITADDFEEVWTTHQPDA